MTKGEIEILTAVALKKRTYKQIASSRIARSSKYILPIIDSLVQFGYLSKSKLNGYQLTAKGILALLEFLPDDTVTNNPTLYRLSHKYLTRAKEAEKMIETLSTEYNMKVERLQN